MSMADKVQITPMVTPGTRDLLRRTCQEKGCSQGDMVEHALLAWLSPSDEGDMGQRLTAIEEHLTTLGPVLQKLTILEEGLGALITLLQASVTPEPLAPESKVPIATYEQMYGPIEAAAPAVQEAPKPTPQPPRPSLLRRWFMREVSA
jgi:hypothetical protein